MSYRKLFCLIGLFLFAGLQPLHAQDNISLKVEVDKAFATIGDEINFRVTATHSKDITVLDINAEDALKDFEIKKTTNFSTEEDGKIIEGKNYVITSYSLGEYVIKPFPVQYRVKDSAIKDVQTNSLYLTLESVEKGKVTEGGDIRGVKGVYGLKNPLFRWFLGLLLMGLTVGVGAWFYLYQKKRVLEGKQAEPALSAHEEAYLALNQLKHSDLIRKGMTKQYFFQISEILRRYLERRFRIRALESTTYELMQEMKNMTNQDQFNSLNDVLTFCDMVKFAKYEPPPLEIIQQSNQAKTVVDKTKEEPAPVLPEEAKTSS